MSVSDLVSDQEWQIINKKKHSWQEDHTVPEKQIEFQGNERNYRLELDQEEVDPTIERKFKTKLEIPNEYSKNGSDRTSAICITADMCFNTRLEADFKREYQMWSFCSSRSQDWEAWRHFLLQFHKFPANSYF